MSYAPLEERSGRWMNYRTEVSASMPSPMTEFPKSPYRDRVSEKLRVGSELRRRSMKFLLHELEGRSRDVC